MNKLLSGLLTAAVLSISLLLCGCGKKEDAASYQLTFKNLGADKVTNISITFKGFSGDIDEIVPDEDYRKGDYYGIWVGTPTENTPHGSMFLGIESDGYTHS